MAITRAGLGLNTAENGDLMNVADSAVARLSDGSSPADGFNPVVGISPVRRCSSGKAA
jgi:hypothetical protein